MWKKNLKDAHTNEKHNKHLMATLAIQAGCRDKAGSVFSRRGQEDEVARKTLVLFDQHDIADLRQKRQEVES